LKGDPRGKAGEYNSPLLALFEIYKNNVNTISHGFAVTAPTEGNQGGRRLIRNSPLLALFEIYKNNVNTISHGFAVTAPTEGNQGGTDFQVAGKMLDRLKQHTDINISPPGESARRGYILRIEKFLADREGGTGRRGNKGGCDERNEAG